MDMEDHQVSTESDTVGSSESSIVLPEDLNLREEQVVFNDESVDGNNQLMNSSEVVDDVSAAVKRGHSEGSPSGISPVCKRTFSLDGKEVSFEHDSWYVGWLFPSLDSMRKEFAYVSDMIAGHEAYKVETNNRISMLEAEKAQISTRFIALEEENNNAKKVIEEMRRELSDQKVAIEEGRTRLQAFRTEWSQRAEEDAYHFTMAFKRHDELEQYSSRECIILHGVPEKKTIEERRNEDTDAIIMEEIGTRLNIEIKPEDIDRSHRLGKFRAGQKKGRSIIVKFSRHNVKHAVYKRKKLFKNSGMMITERLTSRRARFLRYAKEKCGPTNVWTSDGDIFCKLNNGSDGIQNMSDKFYAMENSIFQYYEKNGPDPGWV